MQEGMETHVKEDHYSNASFREMYFRPPDYETNSASSSDSVLENKVHSTESQNSDKEFHRSSETEASSSNHETRTEPHELQILLT